MSDTFSDRQGLGFDGLAADSGRMNLACRSPSTDAPYTTEKTSPKFPDIPSTYSRSGTGSKRSRRDGVAGAEETRSENDVTDDQTVSPLRGVVLRLFEIQGDESILRRVLQYL